MTMTCEPGGGGPRRPSPAAVPRAAAAGHRGAAATVGIGTGTLLSVSTRRLGRGRDVRRRMELDAIDERGGVAEQGGDAVAHRLWIGVERAFRRRGAGDEQAVHAGAQRRRSPFPCAG